MFSSPDDARAEVDINGAAKAPARRWRRERLVACMIVWVSARELPESQVCCFVACFPVTWNGAARRPNHFCHVFWPRNKAPLVCAPRCVSERRVTLSSAPDFLRAPGLHVPSEMGAAARDTLPDLCATRGTAQRSRGAYGADQC